MEKFTCPIVTPEVEEYAENHTTPESEELYQLNRWVHLHMVKPRMLSGAFQGKFLEMISRMIAPKVAVEVGSFAGYSTSCIAQGVQEGGVLHAIEIDDEYEDIILNSLRKTHTSHKVKLHIGNALEVIPAIGEHIDMAFIDADKVNTLNYYNLLVPKMKGGGWILVDNILWSGKVVFDQPESDRDTSLLKQFNDFVQQDSRVENLLLPIRDGVMLCRVL